MIGSATGAGIQGIEGYPVLIETDFSGGLPAFTMVGLLDSEVQEAKERVRTAMKNSGYNLPAARITVNLSPAFRRKEGNGFDLPIAISLLGAAGVVYPEQVSGVILSGELGLDGTVRPVPGILTIASMARRLRARAVVVPAGNYAEASLVKDFPVIPVRTLAEAVAFLQTGACEIPEVKRSERTVVTSDFADVRGMHAARRAAEIAAAGFHNILLVGPPGSGKTTIAGRMPSILPPLTEEEQIELTKIYSVAGLLQDDLIRVRPFRSPHHSVTVASLIGGGNQPKPGEVTLATSGILFLDEFAEFRTGTLDALRQPMEEGEVTISRIGGNVRYPSHFLLIAAMNPCKCGYYPDRGRCRCTEHDVTRYLSHVSGPLLDRIDLCIRTEKLEDREFEGQSESSAEIRERVIRAAQIQNERYAGTEIRHNSELSGAMVKRYCQGTTAAGSLLRELYRKECISFRGMEKLWKVGRTIADLKGKERVDVEEISEAYLYRKAGEELWRK